METLHFTMNMLMTTDNLLATSSEEQVTGRDVPKQDLKMSGNGSVGDNNNDTFSMGIDGKRQGGEIGNNVVSKIAEFEHNQETISQPLTAPYTWTGPNSLENEAHYLWNSEAHQQDCRSQSAFVCVEASDNIENKDDSKSESKIHIESQLDDSKEFSSQQKLRRNVLQDSQDRAIISEFSDVIVAPDDTGDKDDSWCTPSSVLNAEDYALLLKTPKKCFDDRILLNSPSFPDDDEPSYQFSVDDVLVDKSCNMLANDDITALTAEGRNDECPVKAFSQIDLSFSYEEKCSKGPDAITRQIPRFHFPFGKPLPGTDDSDLSGVKKVFHKYNDQIVLSRMKEVCDAVEICRLWKRPLFNCFSYPLRSVIRFNEFAKWWEKFHKSAHDEASRFVYILTNGRRSYLVADDFVALIQDLIETLPSLDFLCGATTFHKAYIKTVIVRIFWTVSRTWNGRISVAELRQSKLLKAIRMLETAGINDERDFFSYQHFYVIYSKFYTLDKDEKNCLVPSDFKRYLDGALTNLTIERIFSGAVTNNRENPDKHVMDYTSFVFFLLAENNKCHQKSIEYWFRIIDLNGDGRITYDEMATFYTEVVNKLEELETDVMSFNDLINMLQDIITPRSSTYFTLSDLKRSPISARFFFNTLINWTYQFMQESDTPSLKIEDSQDKEWDRFCKEEYAVLTAEIIENEEDLEENKNVGIGDGTGSEEQN